ncbi:tetratricopeptide repeat protein [Pararobbsia silviterrae]|uniref:Tetratricopeptide repeat protein n=1 Tax=Pararobbsia silviterrae TaxID=1792498 RepID=A0A494Y2Y1_9BURK|nr:tetratricopeptide repeat protein [Pararobbsia silviterrae]RKP54837.1 tetratricopeptide repeat protein [Pararobbsia silviterrae]
MKKLIAAALLAAASVTQIAWAASPSVKDVEAAIRAGNYAQAETMLSDVVDAHPNSARAHYLYGQVLDRNGKAAQGLAQIEQARTLDPSLKFTDAAEFRAVERHVQADADATGGSVAQRPSAVQGNAFHRNDATAMQDTGAVAPVEHHGLGAGVWMIFVLVLAAVAGVLVWTVRRAKSKGDGEAKEQRLAQLRRSTEVLNTIRSLKLDLRLSTAPGHDVLTGEAEALEAEALDTVAALNGGNPVPDYRVEDLERRLASLKARAEGRPDPNATPAPGAYSDAPSRYAQEAERFGNAPYPGGPAGAPPQTVIVQQPPSNGGGLLTGVLLGSVLSGGFGGRDRVIERDVIVDDDDELRRRGGNNVPDPGIDFGQGGNDWDSGGGGIDTGSGGDGGWTDNS